LWGVLVSGVVEVFRWGQRGRGGGGGGEDGGRV